MKKLPRSEALMHDPGEKRAGYGTRYDAGTPNAVDRERTKGGYGLHLNYSTRRCVACGRRKTQKGSRIVTIGGKQYMYCAECVAKAGKPGPDTPRTKC